MTVVTAAPTVASDLAPIAAAVPGAVVAEEKGSYIIAGDKLPTVAQYLRDKAGYSYLSSVTGVDYLGYKGRTADRFEVVYHLYNLKKGGGPITLKVRAPADNPTVPSLTPYFPGADLQEREIYDLYGIKFNGHPDLRRILLWDGFNGHPMRKDWHEAYYEEERKPFGSRWPEGHYAWAEDRAPWHDNVNYPEHFDPETWDHPVAIVPLAKEIAQTNQDPDIVKTDRIVVNMGPHHPSTHGVLRMIVALEGETIKGLDLDLGYLHRNHEQIGERNTWIMNMPFTDRLDYLSSMSSNLGYATAVEKMANIKVPERAEHLRVIMAELTRICNHMWAVGFLLNDLGAFFTPALYMIEERELILDLFEAVSGSRMMCNYMRFGGVAADLPAGWLDRCKTIVFDRLSRRIDEFERLLTDNEILLARCKGVGYLSPEDAIAYSMSGPMLRASGVKYDVRRAEPYSIYDRFDFDIASFDTCDVYARYLVRIEEMRQSVRILAQAIKQLPEGEILSGKKVYIHKVPAGDAYSRVESPKGELGFYLVSDGSGNPWRYHVRAPSYINLSSLGRMTMNYKVADAIVIFGAIDIVLGETDR